MTRHIGVVLLVVVTSLVDVTHTAPAAIAGKRPCTVGGATYRAGELFTYKEGCWRHDRCLCVGGGGPRDFHCWSFYTSLDRLCVASSSQMYWKLMKTRTVGQREVKTSGPIAKQEMLTY